MISKFIHRLPITKNKPSCLGTGLLTLDLVYRFGDPKPHAVSGGSCGNVMTILSKDGWDATPACHIGNDVAGAIVRSDLERFGVNTTLLKHSYDVQTPVILEFIKKNGGQYHHEFRRTCHKSSRKLPRYTAIHGSHYTRLLSELEHFDVYYFDRLNEVNLRIAQSFNKLGKIVFFEPQHIENNAMFDEALLYVDILKVSSEQVPQEDFSRFQSRPTLTIQTRGKAGVSYWLSSHVGNFECHIEAQRVNRIKDASGCGDWLSASLINKLCGFGKKHLSTMQPFQIEDAIRYGQLRSTKNLKQWGARGGMYGHYSFKSHTLKAPGAIKVKGRYNTIIEEKFRPIDLLDTLLV
jgi:sugar/nucleoside kinase (ribokinase family)